MNKNISELHDPVLLERAIELLAPAFEIETPIFVDCTLGLGGHSEAFLDRFPNLTLVGIDRDPSALALAGGATCSLRRSCQSSARGLRRD